MLPWYFVLLSARNSSLRKPSKSRHVFRILVALGQVCVGPPLTLFRRDEKRHSDHKAGTMKVNNKVCFYAGLLFGVCIWLLTQWRDGGNAKKGIRSGRLTTHILHLGHQDSSKQEDEKMEIKCVNCGRRVNLDHAVLCQKDCPMQDSILYFHLQQGVARKAFHYADPIIWKRNHRMTNRMHSPFDRRSSFDRRIFSYAAHIPERRKGTDRRVSHDPGKYWIRTSPRSGTHKDRHAHNRDL